MTLERRNVCQTYFMHADDGDARPQLISRHSTNLPVGHRNDNKKKALSRRSRSASPCIKKTNSAYSGNSTPSHKYGTVNGKGLSSSPSQLPVIKKQSAKSLKAPRNNLSGAKQRSQVLSDHPKKNLRFTSVWESISSVKADPVFTVDVNSNYTCKPANASYRRANQHVYPRVASSSFTEQLSAFDILPTEIKLGIFSYLNQMDKGRCMLVSKQWYDSFRTPSLWREVNLREFRLCYGHEATSCYDYGSYEQSPYYEHEWLDESSESEAFERMDNSDAALVSLKTPCTRQCYARYVERIDRYVSFLIDIQPRLRRLELSFDLATDNWLVTVKNIFRHINLTELNYVDIEWHDTPTKPDHLFHGSEYRLQDVVYKTRRRQRTFLNFLEEFIPELCNVTTMILPFHWGTRELRYLATMKKLKNLVLKKHTVFQHLRQEVFNELANMNNLEKLLIEVWIGSTSTARYSITSKTLRYLDISQCKGFHLQYVDLPSLEVLKVGKRVAPATSQTQASIPCLCEVLRLGAPALVEINQTRLTSLSRGEMEYMLQSICPSRRHL